MTKAQRLKEFYRRLRAAPAARSLDEAYGQICRILNEVEDELSGIRYNIMTSRTDGRLYPPLWDYTRPDSRRVGITRFQTALHHIFIASNGSIRIVALKRGVVDFIKPGEDGRKVGDT